MNKEKFLHYWVFSNQPGGAYGGNFWDLSTILRTTRYSIKESERNRTHVKPGDIVYMWIYGDCYHGRFVVDGGWKPEPKSRQKWPKAVAGAFPMRDVELWTRAVPQGGWPLCVWRYLSLYGVTQTQGRAIVSAISRKVS